MDKLSERKQIRLKNYDYSSVGSYFVTVCVEDKQQVFGIIRNGRMILNAAGNMVNLWWNRMFKKYDNLMIDEYAIMPNYIHGIINIVVGADPCVGPNPDRGRTHGSAPTISNIIQWFKTMTTNQYIQNVKNDDWRPFNRRLWQRSFYDHVIRGEKSLNRIREYITNNPAGWGEDEYNIGNYKLTGIPRPCETDIPCETKRRCLR